MTDRNRCAECGQDLPDTNDRTVSYRIVGPWRSRSDWRHARGVVVTTCRDSAACDRRQAVAGLVERMAGRMN